MMADRAFDAIVIGAGHNGLATAGYLARAGLRTVVLERREVAGGALETVEISPGFRAPGLAHTTGRLRRSVVRDLRLAEHGLTEIHPRARVFAPQLDGRALVLWSNAHRTAEGLRAWSLPDAHAYPAFDRKVRAIASFLAHVFASTPADMKSPSMGDALAGLRLARGVRRLGSPTHVREVLRVLPMAVADVVGEVFETDALRGAIAARGIQHTAMGPWSAGTAFVLFGDSAGTDGGASGQSTFVRGGPGALADALVQAVRSFGGDVRCEAEVGRVTSHGDRATGVVLTSGEELVAPVVVSALDPKRTLTRMVDPVALGPTLVWRAGNIRMPGVVAKVNLALSRPPRFDAADQEDPQALTGRMVIAPDVDYLERAFDASKYGRVSAEPYVEATIPSLLDPTLAPEGRHVMSVILQYAPYHRREGSWESPGEREGLADLAVKTLEAFAPGLSGLVTATQVLTPLDMEREYGLTEGHPLHGEPGLDQTYGWRPLLGHARYRLPLEGLYLCGSGAHPGGGITGGPGANAAREILADLKRRR